MLLRYILRLLLAGLLASSALLAPVPWPTVRMGVINHAHTAHADGPTNVSGIISSDTTWTRANSPYIVTGSILVSQGVTLTVAPGVTVKFDGNYNLRVDGTLRAIGTTYNGILFTSNRPSPSPGNWPHIELSSTSPPASFDELGNLAGGSAIRFATIEWADQGIYFYNTSPLIDNNAIVNNWHGINYIGYSSPKITNNVIKGNSQSGIIAGNPGGTATIEQNLILNNGDGIHINGPATIRWNTIAKNSTGLRAGAPGTIGSNNI
ncbi:MAG: NosD domain-containing protein, partial [Dehalococcoidia bacterium]|nr:NosD domain-containing protein [Dehalococcoidia bacterium]